MAISMDTYAKNLRSNIVRIVNELRKAPYFFVENFINEKSTEQSIQMLHNYFLTYREEEKLLRIIGLDRALEEEHISILVREIIAYKTMMDRRTFLGKTAAAAATIATGLFPSPGSDVTTKTWTFGDIYTSLKASHFDVYDALCHQSTKKNTSTIIFFLDKAAGPEERGIHDWKTDYAKIELLRKLLPIHTIGIEGFVQGHTGQDDIINGTPELVRALIAQRKQYLLVGLERKELQRESLELTLSLKFWADAFLSWQLLTYQHPAFTYGIQDMRHLRNQLFPLIAKGVSRQSTYGATFRQFPRLHTARQNVIADIINNLSDLYDFILALRLPIPKSEQEFNAVRLGLFEAWIRRGWFSATPEGIAINTQKIPQRYSELHEKRDAYAVEMLLSHIRIRPGISLLVFGSRHARGIRDNIISRTGGNNHLIIISYGRIPSSHLGKGYDNPLPQNPYPAFRLRL